ncbi:CBS domain-containing protein [Streptomyces sp. BH104]|uniref:CBS domain-containing protein n=1 Tax=Streptomyces sp. BH104 TaxID=3410407 RepID=UPI003BB6FCEA
MPQLVHDVMTPHVTAVVPDTPVAEAAQLMREHDIGNVLVCDGDRLLGLVTDRDITLRGHAVRRLPVVSAGRAVGMVSIGDLTEHREPDSALADISRAEPSPGQGTVAS